MIHYILQQCYGVGWRYTLSRHGSYSIIIIAIAQGLFMTLIMNPYHSTPRLTVALKRIPDKRRIKVSHHPHIITIIARCEPTAA